MPGAAERRATLALVASGSALHLLLAWPTLWSTVDDAWITARYALHLAQGLGPVYDAGQWVEGYSDPAWMLLLAAGLRAGLDPGAVMVGAGLLLGALVPPATAWLTAELSGRFDLRAGLAAVLAGSSVHLAIVATNGLETSQWVLHLVLACAAALAMRTARGAVLAGCAAGVLAAIRPEGPFLALACLGWVASQRRALASAWLVGAAPWLLAVQGLRLWLYGGWIANTVAAKETVGTATILAANAGYLGLDGGLWPVVTLAVLGSLALPGRRADRALPVGVGLLALAGLVRVEEGMPGARLMVPVWVLGAAALASAEVPPAWLLLPVLGAAGVLLSPIRAAAVRYDEVNTVQPGNPAARAAALIGAEVPPGTTLAIRDAGVFAYAVGTGVRVIETHPRALTRPHPGGRVVGPPPGLPDLLVTTVQRDDADHSPYPPDRELLARTRWTFLGRVAQHHHRAYDVWARPGLAVPELPADLRLR